MDITAAIDVGMDCDSPAQQVRYGSSLRSSWLLTSENVRQNHPKFFPHLSFIYIFGRFAGTHTMQGHFALIHQSRSRSMQRHPPQESAMAGAWFLVETLALRQATES